MFDFDEVLKDINTKRIANKLFSKYNKVPLEERSQCLMIAVFNAINTYDASKNTRFTTWLFWSIKKECYQYYKPGIRLSSKKEGYIHKDFDFIDDNEFINKKFELLNELDRKLLTLVYLNGYSKKSASEALGVSPRTGYSRIKSAIKKLRESVVS
jgi:RNA polymerase sigma factor (sigma-70 family)